MYGYGYKYTASGSIGSNVNQDVLPSFSSLSSGTLTVSGGTVAGTINPGSADSAVWSVEYGETTGYGSTATGGTITEETAISKALTGLYSNTVIHWRIKAVSSVGTAYSDDQTFNTVLPDHFLLTSRGTGVGVSTFTINTNAAVTVTLSGTAHFYGEVGGTTDLGQSLNLASGYNTMYLKVPSGTSELKINNPANVIKLYTWTSGTNAANMFGNINLYTNLDHIELLGTNTLEGDISIYPALRLFRVLSTNKIRFTNVSSATGIYSIVLSTTGTTHVIRAANVNQILADFWLHRDVTKASTTVRMIDLQGSVYSDGPSGQGITDAAALAAYRTPNNDGARPLWTVLTRGTVTAIYFGTSITAGTGASPATNRWSTLYSALDSLSELNNGVSGKLLMNNPASPDGLSMYETMDLIPVKPNHSRYLFFEFGANDCSVYPTEHERFYTQYSAIIDNAIAKGWLAANIKLLTCFRTGSTYVNFNAQIVALGTAKGVQVLDTAAGLIVDPATYLVDTVHPNNAGHALMANYIDANITAP